MAFGDYEQQVIEAQRRRAVANQLAQQAAVNPVDYGARFVPERGSVAPISRGEQLANLGQMLGSAWMAHRADKKAQAAEDTALKARDTSLASAVENYRNAVPDSQVGDAMGSTIVGNAMRTAANPPTNYVQPQAPQPQPPMGRTQATNNLLDTAMPREQVAQLLMQRAMQQPKPMVVPEGASVIDANRGNTMFAGSPKPKSLQHVQRDTGNEIQEGTFDPVTGRTEWSGSSVKKVMTPGQESTAGNRPKPFSDKSSALLASLASMGVSLPQGLRSREQMVSTLEGLISKYPTLEPDDIARKIASGQIDFSAEKKRTSTAAGIAGKVETAANELETMGPLVRQWSAAVPRGNFVPINKLVQMSEAQISDPNLRKLRVGVNSILNAYDMLAGRGGTDIGKREAAHKLLMDADSPEVLNAALDAFGEEGNAAKTAARRATKYDYEGKEIEEPPGMPNAPGAKVETPSTGPKPIRSDEEFDALPSGTLFVGPDGKTRKKP